MSSWIQGYEFTDGDRPVPAPKRFTAAKAIYDIFDEYRRMDEEDAKRRAKTKRIYLGYLPYNPEDLRRAGQAWRTNMNFKSLANAIDARSDAVAALAIDNCKLVSLVSVSPEAAGPDDERVAAIVEDAISAAIRADNHVIPALAMMNKEADLTGIGPVTFEDPDSYVPVALERGQVVFDPDGPLMSSDHDIIFVDTVIKASTVFSVIQNEELAEKVGWNVKAMKKFALAVFRDQLDTASALGTEDGTTYEETALEMIRRSSFQEARQFKRFHVLYVYVREMDSPRKITHIIVPANSSNSIQDVTTDDFLFIRENAYDTMDDVIVWFPASISQKYAKSVRGVASTLAPISALQDRVTCSMVDSIQRALSLVLHQKNPGATPMNTLQELGPYTVIGADLDPVPNANQMSNFQGAMQVRSMLEQLGPGSVAGTSMAATTPRTFEGGERPSKADAEIQERRRTLRDENHFAIKIHTWDVIISRVCRKFLDIAVGEEVLLEDYPHVKAFVETCRMRGVDRTMLRDIRKRFVFQTCRDIVIGSQGIVEFLSGVAQAVSGNADEKGRKAISHDIIRYRLGEKAADRYMSVASRDDVASSESSVATGENNDIRRLEPAVVGQNQWHLTHIRVHAQLLDEVKQAVEQGLATAQQKSQAEGGVTQNAQGELAPQVEDPERLAGILEAASQHIREHLELLKPQVGVKEKGTDREIEQMLVGLAPTIKALNLAIAEQRRVKEAEQEKRQRELEELQKKASEAEMEKAKYEVDQKAAVERYKVDRMHEVEMARIQLAGQEGQQKLAIEGEASRGRQRLDFEAARTRAAIESEQARQQMALRDAESQHGLALKDAAAAQDARIKAGQEAAERLSASQRVSNVTGREPPQPADLMSGGAAPGVIPL